MLACAGITRHGLGQGEGLSQTTPGLTEPCASGTNHNRGHDILNAVRKANATRPLQASGIQPDDCKSEIQARNGGEACANYPQLTLM